MPGISGVVDDRDPLEDPERFLGAFSDVHALGGIELHHRTLQGPHCAISIALTGILPSSCEQPVTDPGGDTTLFLEGEVFNAPELAKLTKSSQQRSPAMIVLDLFRERGPDFVELLNGNFNIVIYRKRSRELLVFNDRFSSKPFYYLEDGNRLHFGSEKKGILVAVRSLPSIDPVGLLQVFAYRHNLNGRTFLENLRRLPPGSRLEHRDGGLSVSQQIGMGGSRRECRRSTGQLLEEWCELLRQATHRRVRGKSRVLLSLSGGLDSRAIACSVSREFRPLRARTRGFEDSPDVLRATEIAKRLGFDHYREDPHAVAVSEVIPKIVWRTECAVFFPNCMSIMYHKSLKERGDFILGGQFGDVSSGAHIYPYMFLPGSRQDFLTRAYNWYLLHPPSALRGVFTEEFLRAYYPRLKEEYLASFAGNPSGSMIRNYVLWDLRERQARLTTCAAPVDSHLFEKLYPFLDNDYMDFVLSLPTSLKLGQALYQAMIYRQGPEISHIPSANTNLRLHPTVAGNRWNLAMDLGGKAGRKVARKLVRSFQGRRWPGSMEGVGSAMRQDPNFHSMIEGFVTSPHFDSSIFDAAAIRVLLEQHCAGERDHSSLLARVATFAVGLPYFAYDRPRRCPGEARP